MLSIRPIQTQLELDFAFSIRRKVFVEEQLCSEEEEYDGLDSQCAHFLAWEEVLPVGTCRVRTTEKGVKLERFAVLKEHRGKGVGDLLVTAALAEARNAPFIYLHAQDHAVPFYERHGFSAEGEPFYEAGIKHFKMVYHKG